MMLKASNYIETEKVVKTVSLFLDLKLHDAKLRQITSSNVVVPLY